MVRVWVKQNSITQELGTEHCNWDRAFKMGWVTEKCRKRGQYIEGDEVLQWGLNTQEKKCNAKKGGDML